MMTPEDDKQHESSLSIRLVGVGGAGSNVIARLQSSEFLSKVIIDTDKQALDVLDVAQKHCLGFSMLRGLSAGGSLELGEKAVELDSESIQALLDNADLTFLVVGLGGGTGGGAGPSIAGIAAESGSFVIAFAILPFSFEGTARQREAQESLRLLEKHCDAVVSLPNSVLLQQLDVSLPVSEAFKVANHWFERAFSSLHALLMYSGTLNADFSHLQAVFSGSTGKSLFGLGRGEGDHCVEKALQDLMLCPLLHTPDALERASSLLVSIVAGSQVDMNVVNDLVASVSNTFSSKDRTVVNLYVNESWDTLIEVCILGSVASDSAKAESRSLPQSSSVINRAKVEDDIVVHTQKQKKRKSILGSATRSQEEFSFLEEPLGARGYFEKTDENIFEGEDLDVPTYLRKGIKIVLR